MSSALDEAARLDEEARAGEEARARVGEEARARVGAGTAARAGDGAGMKASGRVEAAPGTGGTTPTARKRKRKPRAAAAAVGDGGGASRPPTSSTGAGGGRSGPSSVPPLPDIERGEVDFGDEVLLLNIGGRQRRDGWKVIDLDTSLQGMTRHGDGSYGMGGVVDFNLPMTRLAPFKRGSGEG